MRRMVSMVAVVGAAALGVGCGSRSIEDGDGGGEAGECVYGDVQCATRDSDGAEVSQYCNDTEIWETTDVCEGTEACVVKAAPTDLRAVCE